MATTTVTAIRTALESTIAGLTPTDAGKAFRKGNPRHTWENRPTTDWHRRFTVGLFEEGEPLIFGTLTEIDYIATFAVFVGHLKSTNDDSDMDKLNEDLLTIREGLEKTSNFPTGVSLVRFNEASLEEMESGYLTTMVFRAQYSRAAP